MPAPAKPKPVQFLEVEETEINIQWDPVEGATGYKLLVKDFSVEGDWSVPEVMKHEFDGALLIFVGWWVSGTQQLLSRPTNQSTPNQPQPTHRAGPLN